VVGSGIQLFLVENDIFGCDCLQATRFLDKRRDKLQQVLHGGKRYGNKQSCEDIVTAIVSWSILNLHVCV